MEDCADLLHLCLRERFHLERIIFGGNIVSCDFCNSFTFFLISVGRGIWRETKNLKEENYSSENLQIAPIVKTQVGVNM